MNEEICSNKIVRPGIQTTGFYVGERVVEVYESEEETERLQIHEIAVKIQQLCIQIGIESVLFTSYNNKLDWDMIVELMDFLHERMKLTAVTGGDEIIPTKFIADDERTFVSFRPTFDDDYEVNMLDHNNLRLVKRQYQHYEYVFGVANDDDINDMMRMLSALVIPRRMSVSVYPDVPNKEAHNKIYKYLHKKFSSEHFMLSYDIRVLPNIEVLLNGK